MTPDPVRAEPVQEGDRFIQVSPAPGYPPDELTVIGFPREGWVSVKRRYGSLMPVPAKTLLNPKVYRPGPARAVQPAVRFTNPTTGELLTLDAPNEDLARYLEDIREHERRVREHKHLVNRELISRFDRAAKWTHHIGGFKLSTSSPKPQESWDGAELREALLRFVDEGILSIEAVDAAVSTEIAYKVKANGVKSLRSLGGEIAAAIEGLVTRSEKDRYVSVGRS